MPDENKDDKPEPKPDSLPERVTFWVSLFVVVFLFGFLGWRAFRDAQAGDAGNRPKVTVRLDIAKAEPMDAAHWSVPVTVRNTGTVPLEEVQVRVTQRGADGKTMDTDLTFVYLAENETDDAVVVCDVPPSNAKLAVRVTAFKTQREARGY